MKTQRSTTQNTLVVVSSLIAAAACAVLSHCAAAEEERASQLLWQIGKEDGSHLEFAEVYESVNFRDDYRNLFPNDVHFIVGKHRDADWSPVHPGPDDYWAEHKAHKFTIEFDYDGEPQPMAFSIILVDAHYGQPPVLTIDFNGLSGRFITQRGVGGNNVAREPKRGKRQSHTLYVPSKFVKKGKNVISILNDQGSWLFYDCLKLVAPVGPPPHVIPVDVACSPRLDARGKAVILLDGSIFYWGEPLTASIECLQDGKTVERKALSLQEGTIPVMESVPAGPETEFALRWNGRTITLARAKAMSAAEIRTIESHRYFARLASLYPGNSFYSYASVQTRRMEGEARPFREWPGWEEERREADLYSMTTGLLSIQESLQLEVMLRGAPLVEQRPVPIADLTPPKTRSIPFTEMFGYKEPKVSRIAAMVPDDQYYISFRSVSDARSFMDFFDTWGEHCLKHYGLSAKKALTREKLERQMCVKDLWFLRPITNIAVGEVVLTGSHPFAAQGDDISLIMQVKSRTIFDPALDRFVEQAKKSRPDAKEERFSVGEHDIYSLVTSDREISHYRADVSEDTIVSNSKQAMCRILETVDGKRTALTAAEDFRYMRSIFNEDDPGESGFVFLSESFIRRQIGPKAKIAQARRLQCGTVLKMIANAAILHKHADGKFPKSLEEMIKSQCIESRYLVCPDGGEYSWEADTFSPVCSVHNRLRYLTPIVELKTDFASEREKKEYQRFVERYSNYWRTFFDPVGIQIRMSPSGLTLETVILPLVENSIYRAVTEFAGGMPVPLSPRYVLSDTILSIQAQMPQRHVTQLFRGLWDDYGRAEEAEVLTAEEEAARKQAEVDLEGAFGNVVPGVVKGISDTLDVLGLGEVTKEVVGEIDQEELTEVAEAVVPIKVRGSLNFCDDHMLFGIQAGEIGGVPIRDMGGIGFVAGAAALVLNFPVYGCFGVADPAAAERVLSYTARALAYQPLQEGWSQPRVTLYELEEYRGRKMRLIEAAIGPIRLRGFISIVGYEAYLTPRLSLLKRVIDLAEQPATAPQPYAPKANVALLIRPAAWDKVKSDFQLAWAASAREACLSNFDELQVSFKYFGDMGVPIEKIAEKADGTRYFCPEGGQYQYDPEKNVVKCTIHGTMESPRQPEKMREDASFSRLINGIDQIAISLAFEGQGVRTRVNMTFNDNYNPFGR